VHLWIILCETHTYTCNKSLNNQYIFSTIFLNIIINTNFACSFKKFDLTPSFKSNNKEWKEVRMKRKRKLKKRPKGAKWELIINVISSKKVKINFLRRKRWRRKYCLTENYLILLYLPKVHPRLCIRIWWMTPSSLFYPRARAHLVCEGL